MCLSVGMTVMEWMYVLECEGESNGPNSDRLLGSVSLKANCYGA